MLKAAVVMFVLAIVAALFGFSGLAAGAAALAKIFALTFLALAIVSFIFGRGRLAI